MLADSGLGIVAVLYTLFVLALAVLAVALIVLVFAAIRVLRVSATERQLRIERMRSPEPSDGDVPPQA